MNTTYTLFASALLSILCLGACSNDETEAPNFPLDEEVNFVATLTPSATVATRADKAATSLLPQGVGDVTVIAPGYANTEATWQKAIYTVGAEGALIVKSDNATSVIKRTAKEMLFAAWTTPGGAVDATAKTVDFTSDQLELFVGAQAKEKVEVGKAATTVLPFEHLIGKITLTVKRPNSNSITEFEDVTSGVSFTFPSIKKIGNFTTSLTSLPRVTNGVSGEVLMKTLGANGGNVIYLPPFGNFAENGVFTLTVGGVDYLGTLNNLKESTGGQSIEEIKAGENLVLTIKILDDHSVQFLAATIAPWEENAEGELNNRPCPGIWGGQDLIDFAKGYNQGYATGTGSEAETFVAKYITKEADGRRCVRLYTDIEVGVGFVAIGMTSVPFTDITFDGNGFTISGLKNSATEDDQGLFGYTTNATLRDIRLAGAIIKGGNNVGVLVGTAGEATIIDNCRVMDSNVSGTNHVGGLVGNVALGVGITNCTIHTGSVTGTKNIGGIAGACHGSIANSYAILSNGLSGENAGGLVGSLESGAVTNCYASPIFKNGTHKATNGALIGLKAEAAIITSSYWDNTCIDNEKCPSAVGGSVAFDNATCSAFHALSGRLMNVANGGGGRYDNEAYLFDRLNGYIQDLSGDEGNQYKRWAIIGTSRLPILRP